MPPISGRMAFLAGYPGFSHQTAWLHQRPRPMKLRDPGSAMAIAAEDSPRMQPAPCRHTAGVMPPGPGATCGYIDAGMRIPISRIFVYHNDSRDGQCLTRGNGAKRRPDCDGRDILCACHCPMGRQGVRWRDGYSATAGRAAGQCIATTHSGGPPSMRAPHNMKVRPNPRWPSGHGGFTTANECWSSEAVPS